VRKFLRRITAVRGWLTGYEADEILPTDLGTGTPDSTTVLYGDGRWDAPPAVVQGDVGFEGENKDVVPLAIGTPVCVHSSGTGVRRATAASVGRECVGFANAATAITFSTPVLTAGVITLADWTAVAGTASLSAGAVYFLSATAGHISATPPSVVGQRVQQVGVAITPDTLSIQVMQSFLL
jgi:hypothetical protein